MFTFIRINSLALLLAASATGALAQDTVLFNGKNLDGWKFEVSPDEKNPKPVEEVWVVKQGLLISTGACNGFLKHKGEFENYVLTLDWRSMQLNRNGVAISGAGSVFVHASDEMGSFRYPKSVEIQIFNDPGSVYFRDVDPFAKQKWAFRAPDLADEAEKEMGEWNQLKVICRGNRLTVFLNGTPINQVDGLNRTKGSIALQSQRSAFQAPSYYRNIRVSPLTAAAAQDEKTATARLAKFNALTAQKEVAEKAKQLEKELQEKKRAAELAKASAPIRVRQEIEFTTDARKLPFPADARALQFDAAFDDIELVSKSSLAAVTRFYRTEMAKRGWQEAESKLDDDSVEITFKHREAQVELDLDQRSDGVSVRMDCRGLSFAGTNDPAGLAALGLPQPRAYVFLQKEIKLPAGVRDLEFDGGDRCLFKSDLKLQQAFDQVTGQLRAKTYRETRKPIIANDRRYSEFAKGKIEISVNMFSHEGGSRAILTFKEK